MRRAMLLPAVVLLCATAPAARAADEPQPKPDLGELSKMLQKIILPDVPREYEQNKDWGKTTPWQPGLRLMRLRKTVMVGDKVEFPHGVWQRWRVWLDDPAKDVQVVVTSMEKKDAKTLRLHVVTTVRSHGEIERKRYEKGLQLFGLRVDADTVIVADMDCDVQLTVKGDKFPPDIQIDAQIADCKLQLKEFDVKRVGPVEDGELYKELSGELKGAVEGLLKSYEPDVKKRANEAIARSLKEGKGTLSPAALLKLTQSK